MYMHVQLTFSMDVLETLEFGFRFVMNLMMLYFMLRGFVYVFLLIGLGFFFYLC